MKNTISRTRNRIENTSSKDQMSQPELERIVKIAMPTAFIFWVLLIFLTVRGFSYMPRMDTQSSEILAWTIGITVVFSLFIYIIVIRLIKLLKNKTLDLENQKSNLEEQVLQKTNVLLKVEKMSAIGELSARIAHDIRNPVSIIKNTIEIMKMRNQFDEKTGNDLQRIEKALERISHQVNDILDYVRDAPLKLETCFVSDIMEVTIKTITFPDRIKLKVFPCDIPIHCDPIKLEAVFRNLILNAIQAVPQEGKISIRMIEKYEMAIIEIENSGPGIAESILPKIFDPLFTTKQQGTGLGLPICKTIVEKHGGQIMVHTTENHGSTFVVELPKFKITDILSQKLISS